MGFKATKFHNDVLLFLVPAFLTGIGLLSQNPKLWYNSLGRLVMIFVGGEFCLAAIWEFLSRKVLSRPIGERLQITKPDKPQYSREIIHSALCMYVVACFCAWPMMRYRAGESTAFKTTLEEASMGPYPVAFYIAKTFVIMVMSDTHTWWKHYLLHHPAIYAFHKTHHSFHNPSSFGGFAIHPVEAVFTFAPIVLLGWPMLTLYMPLHIPFLTAWGCLNFYLHCGYRIPLLEWLFPKFYINTSVWHNKHHELSVAHFAEMFTVWDWIMGTHTENWDAAQVERQAKLVMGGKTGMDEGVNKKDH